MTMAKTLQIESSDVPASLASRTEAVAAVATTHAAAIDREGRPAQSASSGS